MAVVQASGYSSDLTRSLETSICCGRGPKKDKKKKKKKEKDQIISFNLYLICILRRVARRISTHIFGITDVSNLK